MPMLMTAAGTVKAARVLILGAGVAGLQAIATAKRLGAVIEAFDVRPAVKEQVESLGAKFVEVALSDEENEGAGDRRRLRPRDERRLQAPPGRAHRGAREGRRHRHHHGAHPRPPAPVLRDRGDGDGDEAGVGHRGHGGHAGRQLRRQRGGPGRRRQHGVKIVAPSNLPATLAADSSALYARNLLNFINLLLDPKTGELTLNRNGRNHRRRRSSASTARRSRS